MQNIHHNACMKHSIVFSGGIKNICAKNGVVRYIVLPTIEEKCATEMKHPAEDPACRKLWSRMWTLVSPIWKPLLFPYKFYEWIPQDIYLGGGLMTHVLVVFFTLDFFFFNRQGSNLGQFYQQCSLLKLWLGKFKEKVSAASSHSLAPTPLLLQALYFSTQGVSKSQRM